MPESNVGIALDIIFSNGVPLLYMLPGFITALLITSVDGYLGENPVSDWRYSDWVPFFWCTLMPGLNLFMAIILTIVAIGLLLREALNSCLKPIHPGLLGVLVATAIVGFIVWSTM